MAGDGVSVVRAGESRPVGEHTEPGGRAGGMSAVAVAIQWVQIRMGNWLIGWAIWVGVVVVTDQVRAAFDLRRIGPQQRGIRSGGVICQRSLIGLWSPWTAKVGMSVINTGVNNRDLKTAPSDAWGSCESRPRLRRPD